MATNTCPWARSARIALIIFAACGLPVAHAQTNLQARLTVRPVTPGDMTAYKLPPGTQISGGLPTVGLGQPLYLELQVNSAIPAANIASVTWELSSKPAASVATLAESPLGKNVPVYEPSDRLVAQVAGRSLLRPDVKGVYVVKATVSLSSGETANAAGTFLGATYVGASTCTLCHTGLLPDDKGTPWSQTGHASMLKEGLDGKLDHYGPGCLSCHTVGYDTNAGAANRGFDDVAKQLNWTFPTSLKEGTWDALPDALKNVSNIQCENCHGPGSVHITGAFGIGLSVSKDSGVCGQCHDAPTHHVKSGEWNNSKHAIATRYPSGAGHEACVGCHAGPGFVDRAKGAKTLDTAYTPINCQTCHEPHGQTTPATNSHLVRTLQSVTLADGTNVTRGGAGLLCMNCHQARQNAAQYAATAPGSARFGGHHGPQADMLEGTNGFTYGRSISSSPHREAVEDTCVTCHMQAVDAKNPAFLHAGGHTFKPSWAGDATVPRQELVGACQKCHGTDLASFNLHFADYDGDGKIDGVQTEVQHLLDKLAQLLPPVGQPKSALTIDSTWSRAQLEAGYNWQFVKEDGSLGIHNTAYAVGLLKASIADLQGSK